MQDLFDFENIPSSWQLLLLEDIVKDIDSGFASGKHNSSEQGVPHLRPMNISKKGDIVLEEVKYVENTKRSPLKAGDVLFNNTNSPVWVSKTALIKQSTDWAYSNHMTRLEVDNRLIHPWWVASWLHFLQSSGYFQFFCTRHVNQASISRSFLLKETSIPLPPINAQVRIKEKIEELFSDLDDGIKSLKTAQQQLKVYRQAVLKWAFEGKLTAKWREEQRRLGKLESANALLEKIKEERSQQSQADLRNWEEAVRFWDTNKREGKKPSKLRALKILEPLSEENPDSSADLPQEWLWEKLGNLSDIVGGVTKGRRLGGKTTISLPYLRVANVQDGYLDLSVIKYIDVLPDDLAKYKLEYGDILYTEGGDRDKPGSNSVCLSWLRQRTPAIE